MRSTCDSTDWIDRRRLGQLGGRVSLRAGAERGLRNDQHYPRRHEAAASRCLADCRSRRQCGAVERRRISSRARSLDLDFANRKSAARRFPVAPAICAPAQSAKGLIQTNRGVMMIAAAPVLDGSGGGEALGIVIMGRLLTPLQVRMLGARAQAALSMVQALPMVQKAASRRRDRRNRSADPDLPLLR